MSRMSTLRILQELFNRRRVFISGAHDEYWSWQGRANLERALAKGTNLFFSGANAIYWQVRPEKDGTGARIVFWRSTRKKLVS